MNVLQKMICKSIWLVLMNFGELKILSTSQIGENGKKLSESAASLVDRLDTMDYEEDEEEDIEDEFDCQFN